MASTRPSAVRENTDDLDSPSAAPAEPELPLSMSTSTLLHPSNLPSTTAQALQHIHETLDPPTQKVTIRFQPLPGAPPPSPKWAAVKVSASQNFESVVSFLRKKLGVKGGNGLFVYVNKVFAPGLDEGVGGLWRCFKIDDELKVSYSMAPAFG
ncbi:Ubiquitin-like protein [Knufia obscura]|uniref:Ubiquitin-like protein ATG12 n=2 Tax=Knufia TaxID=430999 RepID=A0AAN8F345_9EURO|nr:Ubiquitin-like protein [Knufia obscura]KAK5950246.1 Ubiquitin-like protein [Knufia fluminis]